MVGDSRPDDRPDIVIGGFPKAGTTALATLLSEHRQISLVEPKEPHRFSWGLDTDIPACFRANGLGAAAYEAAIAAAGAWPSTPAPATATPRSSPARRGG